MKIHLAIVALFVVLCLPNTTFPAQPDRFQAKHRDDQILVMPKPGVNLDDLGQFHLRQKTSVLRSFPGLRRLQVLKVPKGESVADCIARYEAGGLVEFAEPDYEVQMASNMPNDPKFTDGTQWSLNNTGQNSGTPDADIDGPEAWDIMTSASNVVVAVLDTGIRYTHEDLAANMWTNPSDGSHGWNVVADNNDPNDDLWHGTYVAGIIGAAGNNKKGICGVAWQVQLMAIKFLNNAGEGSDSTLIAGIEFARTNGAQIINISASSSGYSEAVSNAIVAARDAGIIVCAAAGNDGVNTDISPRYPACYDIDNIVSVTHTWRNDMLDANFSNYGLTNVDLAAPGYEIYSTYPATDSFYYQLPYSLSSFAAAHVSGALALIKARFPNDSHQQIIARLLAGTDPLPSLAGQCVSGGRLNLRKALSPDIQLTPLAASPFQFSVAAGPSRQCVIETSTNLMNWTAVTTNTTSTNGTFLFTNSIAAPPQFFRATAAP